MTEAIDYVRAYFDALNRIDRQAFLACFAEDATARDPYGAPAHEGGSGLNKFFDGVERTWREFRMEPEAFYAGADRVAVPWRAVATTKNGKQANFEGVNVFTVGQDGKIRELDAYWDFKAMLKQIQ